MCEEPAPVPVRSRLERLPVELIQNIFFHCLEFNFPRASIHIARALSNPSIYTWLMRLAFTSDNPRNHDLFTPDYLPPSLDFFGMSGRERGDLQSAILESRWCTLPFMRKCQKEYIQRVISNVLQRRILLPEYGDGQLDLEQRFEESTSNTEARCASSRNPVADFTLYTTLQNGRKARVIMVWFHLGLVEVQRPGMNGAVEEEYRFPKCESIVRMPAKLLCPPWTAEKLNFLTILSEEVYMDEDEEFDCSRRILRQVIRDRDFATFQRLLGLYIKSKHYKYPREWPLLPTHFRAALKYADEHDDPFVRYLVKERWCDLPDEVQLKFKVMMKYARDRDRKPNELKSTDASGIFC